MQTQQPQLPVPGRMWRTSSGPVDPSSGPRPRRIDVLLPTSLAQLRQGLQQQQQQLQQPPPPVFVNAFMRRQGTREDRNGSGNGSLLATAQPGWQLFQLQGAGGGAGYGLQRPRTAGAAAGLTWQTGAMATDQHPLPQSQQQWGQSEYPGYKQSLDLYEQQQKLSELQPPQQQRQNHEQHDQEFQLQNQHQLQRQQDQQRSRQQLQPQPQQGQQLPQQLQLQAEPKGKERRTESPQDGILPAAQRMLGQQQQQQRQQQQQQRQQQTEIRSPADRVRARSASALVGRTRAADQPTPTPTTPPLPPPPLPGSGSYDDRSADDSTRDSNSDSDSDSDDSKDDTVDLNGNRSLPPPPQPPPAPRRPQTTTPPPSKLLAAAVAATSGTQPAQQQLLFHQRRCRLRQRIPAMVPSLFPNVPPVLNFAADGECLDPAGAPGATAADERNRRQLLKWRLTPATPAVVRRVLARSGFRFLPKPGSGDDIDTVESDDWLGYFGKHLKPSGFSSIGEYQKVNHFPGSFALGRKDRLWQGLRRMRATHGDFFDIAPATYCLPEDLRRLRTAWEAAATATASSTSAAASSSSSLTSPEDDDDDQDRGGSAPPPQWILKPPASARGQGIRLITRWHQVPKSRSAIVQSYVARPYLIDGNKFDLRIYVYVTSFEPLRAYVHELGLVRFASSQYVGSEPGNRFAHLTNYSVNKHSRSYRVSPQDGHGHKWSLQALWTRLRSDGRNPEPVWEAVKDVAVKALLSAQAHIAAQVRLLCKRSYCVHELFGFDVLLDDCLRPWLLEVNISPSLHTDSQLDSRIKDAVIADSLRLAGFQLPPPPATSQQLCCWPDVDTRTRLADDERAKQEFHTDSRHWCQRLTSLLEAPLTPWDIRCLAHATDELHRRGGFQLLMPAGGERGLSYLRCLDRPGYADLLLHAFATRYGTGNRGVELLTSLCRRGHHVATSSGKNNGSRHAGTDRQMWTPPAETK